MNTCPAGKLETVSKRYSQGNKTPRTGSPLDRSPKFYPEQHCSRSCLFHRKNWFCIVLALLTPPFWKEKEPCIVGSPTFCYNRFAYSPMCILSNHSWSYLRLEGFDVFSSTALLVNLVAFVEVDGPPFVAFETGVEEP
jgi:hypothetical protein